MSGPPESPAAGPRPVARRCPVAAGLLMVAALAAGAAAQDHPSPRPARVQPDAATPRDEAALVGLADAAMEGRAGAYAPIGWRNDFFKAQSGTFVPFTLTIDRSRFAAASALMYLRAVRRGLPEPRARAAAPYPFELVFPVELPASAAVARITRGFAVPPGDYDIIVVLRERRADGDRGMGIPAAAVLRQPLAVPDFWSGELATSTVMLADRIEPVEPLASPDAVLERPYVIGGHEVHLAVEPVFRRDRELIVVFLIYNPAVQDGKTFDVQVDYHLFRAEPRGEAIAGEHPAARPGERYVTRTTPQRFRPEGMGPQFDPASGQPILAGQGILLSSFEEGEYRLGITVTDLLSGRALSRDVTFRVVGS